MFSVLRALELLEVGQALCGDPALLCLRPAFLPVLGLGGQSRACVAV